MKEVKLKMSVAIKVYQACSLLMDCPDVSTINMSILGKNYRALEPHVKGYDKDFEAVVKRLGKIKEDGKYDIQVLDGGGVTVVPQDGKREEMQEAFSALENDEIKVHLKPIPVELFTEVFSGEKADQYGKARRVLLDVVLYLNDEID